jgi:endonuclease I
MRSYLSAAKLLTFSFLFVTSLSAQTPIGGSLNDTELRAFLKETYYTVNVLGYNTARDRMFGNIDPVGGIITCVYTGFSKTGTTRGEMNAGIMINTEHTWPQSLFNSSDPMMSDLHHLYPTWANVNSSRSNNPFAQLDDNLSSTWFGGSFNNPISTSSKPAAGVIHLYSQSSGSKFEPRDDHKGDVARSMFYFWTMYSTHSAMMSNNAVNVNFFNGMKDDLYAWHKADPVDSRELNRTNAIASYQGKPNPFILDSTLVRRSYFFTGDGGEEPPPPPPPPSITPGTRDSLYLGQIVISQYYEGASNNKWLEIANVGQFTFDFDSTAVYVTLFANPASDVEGDVPTSSYRLTGRLAPGSTRVLKNGQAVLPSYTVSNAVLSAVANFNGNDPIVLSTTNDSQAWANRFDVFGMTDGTNFAADVSYIRKPDQLRASRDYDANDWVQISLVDVDAAEVGTSERIGKHVSHAAAVIPGSAGWRLLSIPSATDTPSSFLNSIWTQGSIGADITTGSPNVLRYNANTIAYESIADLTQTLTPGTGIAVGLYANDTNQENDPELFPKILSVANPIETGEFSFNLVGESDGYRYNLIGNPYRYAIDWDYPTGWDRDNLSQSIYLWNSDSSQFAAWNGLVGTIGIEDGVIPAYQGFFVLATDANPELMVKPEAIGGNRVTYKTSDMDVIRFSHSHENGYSDAVMVAHTGGQLDVDAWDAFQMNPFVTEDPATTVHIRHQERAYAILSVPPLTANMSVDVVITNPIDNLALVIEKPEGLSVVSEIIFQSAEQVVYGVSILTASSVDDEKLLPNAFTVSSAYPNPFNPQTSVSVDLPTSAHLTIGLFDVMGREVRSIASGSYSAGRHTVSVDGAGLASGVYYIRVTSAEQRSVVPVMLLK